ncbi:hypothetical protein D3C76_1349300 [compost metagenome]
MQFRITARQIQAVRLGQNSVTDRREKPQLGTHRPQQIQAGAIGEGKRLITGHGDAHANQKRFGRDYIRRGEGHRRWQRDFATAGQGVCRCIQAHVQVVQLAGLHQAQVATWQFNAGLPRQGAVPAQAFGQAAFE